MASSELPKTGGSEGSVWSAETEEFNRDKAIEVLEEVGTFKILAEAAAAFGKEDIWGYDYESMSDDELSAFFDKVNEIRGAEDGDPKGDDDPRDDGSITDADPGNIGGGAKHENNEGTGDKVLKKKVGGKILKTAGAIALLGGLFAAGVFAGTKFHDKQLGDSGATTSAGIDTGDAIADSLDGGSETVDADQYSYDSAANGVSKEADAESEHNYGERYENISEVTTFRGEYASEDGTEANSNKINKYAFGPSLTVKNEKGETKSDAELKADHLERMTQITTLASTYDIMKINTTNPNFGVDVTYTDANDLAHQMANDPELHQKVYDFVYESVTDGGVRITEANGRYVNYYVDADFAGGTIESGNWEVVGCITEKDHAPSREFSNVWYDEAGVKHEDWTLFFDSCGDQGGRIIVTEVPSDMTTLRIVPEPSTPTGKTPPTETTPGEPTTETTTTVPTTETPTTETTTETTTEDNSKDPKKINERAGDDVTYDTDGSAKDKTENPVNDWQTKPTKDGEGGGKPADSEGEDGKIQDNIDNGDKKNNDAQNVSNPDERASEEQKEKEAQEKEKTAKENNAENENKSNEERKNDTDTNNDGKVDLNEALQ